jgi:hypothetical protein
MRKYCVPSVSRARNLGSECVCSFGTLMTINTPHQRGAPKRFSIPLERIESLRPALRFRVPLQEGAHELEILRQKAGNTPRVPL